MSVLRVTALGVYLTVAAWAFWSRGIPFERTVVIAWMVGAAVLALGGRQRGLGARAVADWVPFVLLMIAYDLTRGAADGLGMPLQVRLPIAVDEAVFGTVPTVALQERLGPFGYTVHWWEVPVGLVYVSHYIVPFALGVWWWSRDRTRWIWWRDRFVTLTVLGLATYLLLPTAPPWMASQLGEIGPVQRTASRGWSLLGIDVADRVFDLGRAAVNQTAALPSLHAAFAAFVAVAVWRRVRPAWRPLVAAYPVAMAFALVVSGEHYVVDVALGWIYVAATILLWRRIGPRVDAWRLRRSAAVTTDEPVLVPTEPPPVHAPVRRVPVATIVMAALLAVLAAISRAVRLGRPGLFVFDEAYYATQALEIAQTGVEQSHTVHPPVAKWVIAAGIRAFGFAPVAWRLAPLVAGAIVVGLTVVIAQRATASHRLAAVAGVVVLTDGIAVTTGRLALLDGLVALWTTAALLSLVSIAARPLDRHVLERSLIPLGILFGLAIATKWSAAPIWLVSVGFLSWLMRAAAFPRRRAFVMLLGIPVAVYALSFVPTFIAYEDSAVARLACADGVTCGNGPIDRLHGIVHDHLEVLHFHTSLEPSNRYAVSSWNWIVQTQPTVLYADGTPGHTIEARSNPVVWVLGAAALCWCGWVGARRKRPVHLLLAVSALTWWAPWAIAQRPGYSFYAAPLVPVLAAGLAVAIGDMPVRWRSPAVAGVVTIAVIGAVVLAPRWYG